MIFEDFNWKFPFLKVFTVIANRFRQAYNKSVYGKCSKITNTLKLRTRKIIAKNNF